MAARSANCACKACRCGRTRSSYPRHALRLPRPHRRPGRKYPQVPERAYLAGVASVETLQSLGATRGISRFVIVQPSFYGADNSATLDALDALEGNGRGVAVIDPARDLVRHARHVPPPGRARPSHQSLQPDQAARRRHAGSSLCRHGRGGAVDGLARPGDRAAAGAVGERRPAGGGEGRRGDRPLRPLRRHDAGRRRRPPSARSRRALACLGEAVGAIPDVARPAQHQA